MSFGHPDKDYIWSAVRAMLDGYLRNERAYVDSFIHPEVTLWDSVEKPLILGLEGLNALRDRRPAAERGDKVVEIQNLNPFIDILGDIAICRYELLVKFDGVTPDEHIRNTAVWKKFPAGWLVIHNHEDVLFDENS